MSMASFRTGHLSANLGVREATVLPYSSSHCSKVCVREFETWARLGSKSWVPCRPILQVTTTLPFYCVGDKTTWVSQFDLSRPMHILGPPRLCCVGNRFAVAEPTSNNQQIMTNSQQPITNKRQKPVGSGVRLDREGTGIKGARCKERVVLCEVALPHRVL